MVLIAIVMPVAMRVVGYSRRRCVAARSGKFATVVPMLIGSNLNEGTVFNPLPKSASEAMLMMAIEAQFGAAIAQQAIKLVRACRSVGVRPRYCVSFTVTLSRISLAVLW